MSADTSSPAQLLRLPPIDRAQQVIEALSSYIKSADLKSGDRLPAERELMAALAVGRSTIREVISHEMFETLNTWWQWFNSRAAQREYKKDRSEFYDRIRSMWGFPDKPGASMQDKFQTRYRGIRVSFGYPACPNLEDQAGMFRLLDPEKNIGVKLSENFMMEPEASVSAMVFHHPDCAYFTATEGAEAA